jgi:Domain of unknown function (DUF4258)
VIQEGAVAAPTTDLIRSFAKLRQYVLSAHAERERQTERITTAELEAVLKSCEILEDYPDDPRGHSCLVLGFANARPIHAVCAAKDNPREVLLITVYDPSLRPERWDATFRRRRKP